MILCAPLGDSVVAVCGTRGLTVRPAVLSEEDGEVIVVCIVDVLDGNEVGCERTAIKSSCFSITKCVIIHSEISINVARRVITVSRKLRWEELGVSLSGSIMSSFMTAVPAKKS
jgi:hypothetical protein